MTKYYGIEIVDGPNGLFLISSTGYERFVGFPNQEILESEIEKFRVHVQTW